MVLVFDLRYLVSPKNFGAEILLTRRIRQSNGQTLVFDIYLLRLIGIKLCQINKLLCEFSYPMGKNWFWCKNSSVSLWNRTVYCEKERKRYDSVLWQKPLQQQKIPKSKLTTQTRHQNLDYTTIAGRLRTVSWSNDSHPTSVVKPVYGIRTFPLITKRIYKR